MKKYLYMKYEGLYTTLSILEFAHVVASNFHLFLHVGHQANLKKSKCKGETVIVKAIYIA